MHPSTEKMTKKTSEKTVNKDILIITYFFVFLFVAMIINMVYFVAVKSENVINTSYNHRQAILAERVVRGRILSEEGKVLAETKVNKKGKEYRNYPYGRVFCHVVGRFTEGKTGVEASEDFTLLASHDNAIQNAFLELSGEKLAGDDVILTIQAKLQQVAYDALGDRKGAVVVMEPDTGKILAMVSKPDYDPNTISANWDSITKADNNNSPLLNRATQGLYPPGSTFKILTALEYIREFDADKFSYTCEGKDSFAGVPINCYQNKVHGQMDLLMAFAKSCNCAFAYVGEQINLSSFRALCETFYFNTSLPTNLVTEQSSFALTAQAKKEEVPQTVIGQGETLLTPLHNAVIVAAVANKGVAMRPYVVDRVESSTGILVKENKPEEADRLLTEEEASALKKMMKAVVQEGTGYGLENGSYQAAGKTGTAEYNSKGDSHAWFVGFAPYKNPKIVVSIIVEGAGTGSDYAVPIAKKIFDAYLK